jgi:protein-export SecD/SecF family membrane protein
MNKRKAITKFAIIGVLVLVGILSLFNWTAIFGLEGKLPYKFNGLLYQIEDKAGIDLRGGVLAGFETEEVNPTDAQLDATIKRLERMLADRGHFDTTVTRQGSRQIRIEMPGTDDTSAIFEAIGTPAKLEMRVEGQTEPFITGEHVQRVEYTQDPQSMEHGVKLTFTAKGGELFRAEVAKATIGTTRIQILLNGEVATSPVINSADVGKDNTAVISGGYTIEQAKDMKTQIESGLFEITFKKPETSIIPATLGADAMTAGIIACIVGLLFIFVVMWVLYGDLGLLSNLSMLVFVVLFLLALAVIESVQLTLPGIAGIIISIGMAVDANILIFERIKDEFKSGKRMAVAVESGFNKTVKTIVDANITTVIAAAVLYLLGTGPIQGFAITLFLGVAISMFCSLLVTRSFAKTYLYINNNNEKRLRLSKGDIKETAKPESAKKTAPAKRSLNFGGNNK